MDSNDSLAQNVELQLSEFEMLNSMFPNEGEIVLTDPGVITDFQDFLSGKLERGKLSKLEYTINLDIWGVSSKEKCNKFFLKSKLFVILG